MAAVDGSRSHHSRSTSRSTRRAAAGLKDQSGQESVLAGRTERDHNAVVVHHFQGAEESELHAATPVKPPAVVNFTEAYQAVTLQAGQVALDGRWISAPALTASPRRRRALRRFLAGDEQGL